MSREGGNVLGGRKTHHLRHKTTLLMQNRPPNAKIPSRFAVKTLKIGFMREVGGCFFLVRVEWSRRAGTGRGIGAVEADMVCGGWKRLGRVEMSQITPQNRPPYAEPPSQCKNTLPN